MYKFNFFLLVFVLCSLLLRAQTVDEIISRNIQARGGMEALKAVQSLRITGHIENSYGNTSFVELRKRDNKFRIEVPLPSPFPPTVEGYDGKNGWQIMPGVEGPVDDDGLRAYEALADMDGPLVDYRQKGNTVEMAGREKVLDSDAYHLKVTLKNGSIRDIYLDSQTYLETRLTKRLGIQNIDSFPGDYRKVNGIMMAFSSDEYTKIAADKSQLNKDQLLLQKTIGEQGSHDRYVIEKIEMNVPIDDSTFRMPAKKEKQPAAAPPSHSS
jgi:outer membrane lipoprotein-sorting protein